MAEAEIRRVMNPEAYLMEIMQDHALGPIRFRTGWQSKLNIWIAAVLAVFQLWFLVVQYLAGQAVVWPVLVFIGFVVFLVVSLQISRGQLDVQLDRVDLKAGGYSAVYRFADLSGPFELRQRNILPGFDIVFAARSGGPLREVRRIHYFDVSDTVLCDILNVYRARASG